MTGLRAGMLAAGTRLSDGGRLLQRHAPISEVEQGEAFWDENANGLAEIAVNTGRACDVLGLAIGSPVRIVAPAASSC